MSGKIMPGNGPEHQPLHCPLYTSPPVVPCDPAELDPLLMFLRQCSATPINATFPRGTVMDDGRLDLCKQALGPAGCRSVTEALAHNHSIVSLLLGTDGIGNAGAADVAHLADVNKTFQVLYLGCNKIDALGVAPLAVSLSAPDSSVTGLWLKRNPVGSDGAQQLAEMLKTNRTLQTLDLVNTRLGPDGLAALADALIQPASGIERLYLGGNFLTSAEAPLLAKIIEYAPRLRALLLNVGFLGDDGAAVLASALPNARLQELGLASNGIGSDGAARLFEAAAVHPTLTILDLGYAVSTRALGALANTLGDSGAAAAADCLAQNPSLVRLDLRGSGISARGLDQLADALAHNTRLQSLTLDGKCHAGLTERLTRNRALAAEAPAPVSRDVLLTRSVYRTG